MIGADLRLLDQVPGVRHLAQVELLVEPVIGIEPAHMRGGEGDVAFRIAFCELLLIEPIDRATRDVLDRDPRFSGKLLADDLGNHVAPAPAPDTYHELVLRRHRRRYQQKSQRAECDAKPLHAPTSLCS